MIPLLGFLNVSRAVKGFRPFLYSHSDVEVYTESEGRTLPYPTKGGLTCQTVTIIFRPLTFAYLKTD